MELLHLGKKDIEMKEEKEKETEDFFHSNELIIKLFINKLIIWSVRRQHISELEKQMNSFICSYIEENVRNTISLNFIAYEEEENIDEMNESTIQNKNTWVELHEPVIININFIILFTSQFLVLMPMLQRSSNQAQ